MSNKYVIIDIETELIGPLSVGHPTFIVGGHKIGDQQPRQTQDMKEYKKIILAHAWEGYTIVGHNISFDLGVLGFKPNDLNSWTVHDTGMVDLLHRLSQDDCGHDKPGPPRMRKLTALTNVRLPGKGTTQLSFRRGVKLTKEQKEYLNEDLLATERVFLRQPKTSDQVKLQIKANMALTMLSHQGIRVSNEEIAQQRIEYVKIKKQAARELQEVGVYTPARVGPKGGQYKASCNTKMFKDHVKQLYKLANLRVECTDKGNVKTDKTTLKALPNDAVVSAWLNYKGAEKVLSTFLNAWTTPQGRIHPRYRSPMRTGRTSSHKPNLQQIPSKGGLKKIFLPEKGKQFYEIDYNQLELCCIAQLTQGRMLNKINAGEDLHKFLASVFLHKPTEEVTKDDRQLAKQANFGLPGGMGTATFRKLVRTAGLEDPGEVAARELKNAWFQAYPEMEMWLKDHSGIPWHLQNIINGKKTDGSEQLWEQIDTMAMDLNLPQIVRSMIYARKGGFIVERWLGQRRVVTNGRVRFPVSYTELHNCKFQGLAADLTKNALCTILDLDVVVHGFIHDSFLISGDEKTMRMVVDAMLDSASKYLPSVRVGVGVEGPGKSWHDAKQQEERNYYNKERSS